MAAASGGDAYCTARLPLVIKQNGKVLHYPYIETIAKELNKDITSLKHFISENEDLRHYVNITSVTFEDNTIFLILYFKTSESLNKFYECISKAENRLTTCLGQYFSQQQLQLTEELKLSTKLTCGVSMSEDQYLKLQTVFKRSELQSQLEKRDIAEAKDMSLLEKRFMLCYPEKRRREIHRVVLEFPKFPSWNVLMTCNNKDKRLYEAVVSLPINILENDMEVKYKFWIVGTDLKKSYNNRFEEESIEYLVCNLDCCRTIMIRSKQIIYWENWTHGYLVHLKDLIFCKGTVREKCIEAEYLHKYLLPYQYGVEVIKRLILAIDDKGYDPSACLLFLAVAGLHKIAHDLGKCLNQTQARNLIDALHSSQISELPISSHEFVESVYKELCFLAYKPNILAYWNMSYSFTGIKFVHSSIIKYLRDTIFDGDQEVILNASISLCEKLFLDPTTLAKEDIELLLSNMPLPIAIQCCNCLLSKNKEHFTPAQMEILCVINRIFESRIPNQLVSLTQENNLADILKTWTCIAQIEVLKSKLFGEYEDVVLRIFESSSNSNSDIVNILVDEHGFFTEPPKLRKLFHILAKSKRKEANELFFALAKHHRVKEQLLLLSREDIYDVFKQLTTDQSRCTERDQSFSFACQRLNDFWGLPQMEFPNYKEVWDEILEQELKKHTVQQLIDKLNEINRFSERISHFGEMFLNYFKSIMDGENAVLKPREILLLLGEQHAKLRIENKLTAQLLNLVIETLAKQYRTDMFGLFLDMMQDADFWQTVYICDGEFACHVFENECFKRSKACLVHMVNQLKGYNVSYEFVSNAQRNVKLWNAFEALLQLECSEKDLNKWWEEVLLTFIQVEHKLQKTSKVLENMFEKIYHKRLKEDMSELLNYIKSKIKELNYGSLTANDCSTIWIGFDQLPELCENLEEVTHSNLFWNVSLKKAIQIFMFRSQENEDTNNVSEDVSILSIEMATTDSPVDKTDRITIQFLNILSSTGKVFYRDMWKEVLENTSLRISIILEIFGTKPDILYEVELAKRVLHLNVDTITQTTLQRIYSLNEVRFKVDAVVSTLAAFKVELNEDFSSAIHSFYQLTNGSANDSYFHDVKIALENVFQLIAGLTVETIDIMNKLGTSGSPIKFLQDIVDKDIRLLIDAEENILEQQTRETTVSNLFEFSTCVQPLLTLGSETCQELIFILESQTKYAPGIPYNPTSQVSDFICRLSNLKSLHYKVFNQIKQNKEMIENIIQKENFAFKLDSECRSVKFEVKYSQEEKGRITNENKTRPKSILDEKKLDLSDPSFLNRFEKQYLRFSDNLDVNLQNIFKSVERWIEYLAPNRKKEDIFPIYHEDIIASLILKHINDSLILRENDDSEILNKCKNELLWVLKPEIIVQMRWLAPVQSEHFIPDDVIGAYLSLPLHDGLSGLVQHNFKKSLSLENRMCIVFTNSTVYSNITVHIDEEIQVEKLKDFKSENQLSSVIQYFLERNDCGILVLQCNAKSDEKHILLTKLVIESQLKDYLLRPEKQHKQVYVVIHLDRSTGDSNCLQHLNYLPQWHLVMLDSIETPKVTLPEMFTLSLSEAVNQRRPLNEYLKEELVWAFTRIKYGPLGRNFCSFKNVLENIKASDEFLRLLDLVIGASIEKQGTEDWQEKVALDKALINSSTSFNDAMERFVLVTIKMHLGKLIYKFELTGILDSYFLSKTEQDSNIKHSDVTAQKRSTWTTLVQDNSVFNIMDIPEASGPEFYLCETPDFGLIMPFSRTLFDLTEVSKNIFLEDVQAYRLHCLIFDDDQLPTEIYEELLNNHKVIFLQHMPDLHKFLYTDWKLDYLEDFCNQVSFQICQNIPRFNRVECTKMIMKNYIEMKDDPVTFIIRIHSAFWVNQLKIRAQLLLINANSDVFPVEDREITAILGARSQKYLENSTEIKLQPHINEKRDDEDVEISMFEDIIQENVNKQVNAITEHMELTPAELKSSTDELNEPEKHSSLESDSHHLINPEDYFVEILSKHEANDYLVEFLCKKMLPNTEYFALHQSVQGWLNKVTWPLTLACQFPNSVLNTCSLKLCCDLASELIVPFNLDVALLINLGNILQDGYKLDSDEVFHAIEDALYATKLKDEHLGKEVCVRLVSSYVAMCLVIDHESSAVEFLFTFIKQTNVHEKCIHLLKAPLWIKFNLVEKQSFQNLLLRNVTADEETSDAESDNEYYDERFFLTLDGVIRYLFKANEQSHPFLVLLVDLFQSMYENDFTHEVRDDETEKLNVTEKALETLYVCLNYLMNQMV